MFKGFFNRKGKNKTEEAVKDLLETVGKLEENDGGEEMSTEEPSAEIEEAFVPEEAVSTEEEQPVQEEPEADNEEEEETSKKGFFARLREGLGKTRTAISDKVDAVLISLGKIDEDLYEELEEALVMSDIGAETSSYIIEELKARAKARGLSQAQELKAVLREIVTEILSAQDTELHIDTKPAVVLVIGVNGVGKTTSIGKLAHYYKTQGKQVVLAAGDTFRAAAIDQLEIWAERAGVDIVKHREGADPSAVVYDSIQAAKARGADLVICDTAGRLHNKKNLMEELKKTGRVVERETGETSLEVLLVLDASTGQNALVQAREFSRAAGITGVILTKLDGTAKGGVILALSREQGIGVKFIGVGEQMDDLRPFDPAVFAQALFPEQEQ
ncbi:MAG: signal recognition particle-docking protein FtsY [Ruminococcaceae bacterium]|nr:signal recognition particle-docking protein FtsY [Oscillospiraceae bacterium]